MHRLATVSMDANGWFRGCLVTHLGYFCIVSSIAELHTFVLMVANFLENGWI